LPFAALLSAPRGDSFRAMPRTVTIAVAQLHPRKGDYAANVARVGTLLAELAQSLPRPQVVHLPETVLSGYFVEGGVRDVAVTAGTLAADLDAAYRGATRGAVRALDVVAGFYERSRGTLYNAAAYLRLGEGAPRVLHVHRKAFLPTYGLFDEERFVERGHDIRAFDTPWGRAAMLICEDAWHSLSGTIAALDDAEVIFVSSAAPARGIEPVPGSAGLPASVGRWERLVRELAEEHGVFVSLANLVGSEGGKVFAGCSAVMGPHGDLRVRGSAWEEQVVLATLDLGDIGRARADTPLLADLRTALPHLQRALDAVGRGAVAETGDPAEGGDLATRIGAEAKEGAAGATGVTSPGREGAGGRSAGREAAAGEAAAREVAGPPPTTTIAPPTPPRFIIPLPFPSFHRRRPPTPSAAPPRSRSTPRSSSAGSCASFATRWRAAASRTPSSASPAASTRPSPPSSRRARWGPSTSWRSASPTAPPAPSRSSTRSSSSTPSASPRARSTSPVPSTATWRSSPTPTPRAAAT